MNSLKSISLSARTASLSARTDCCYTLVYLIMADMKQHISDKSQTAETAQNIHTLLLYLLSNKTHCPTS